MGHGGADLLGDGGGFGERAALVAGGAEAALFTGEREKEVVAAGGAVQAGKAGVQVAATQEGVQAASGRRGEAGQAVGVIMENLPDWRSVGLAGTITVATHGLGRNRAAKVLLTGGEGWWLRERRSTGAESSGLEGVVGFAVQGGGVRDRELARDVPLGIFGLYESPEATVLTVLYIM